jgi:hypothetical protein
LLASTAAPFDLVVADLLFPREDFPDELEDRGLDIIRAARQHCAHAFILAITTGDDRLHDLLDDAKNEGAHHVVRRNDFSTTSQVHSPAAIARKIREHLLDNGTVRPYAVAADPGDPGVQGLLHQVGEPTIARLYARMLEAEGRQTDRIELRFLTPGASGASVCGVTAQVDGIPVSHILKLSKAEDVLAREAARGRQARDAFTPSLLVQHQPPYAVGPVNGWYALGSPLLERATTLRQWLGSKDPPAPDAVADLMEALFVDRLAPVYARGEFRSGPPLGSFAFTAYRQQLILRTLDELREALERDDGGGLGRETDRLVSDLSAFITQRRLPGPGGQRPVPSGTYMCYSHGDLHASNVMIPTGRHPPPQLIDTSHTAVAHWATDPAWLAADLLMRSVDAGTESMLFTGFGVWRDLARKFGAGEDGLTAVTTTPATSAALAALSWIATNLHRVSPVMEPSLAESAYRWEWHLSLARNLLRCTYHSDIPHAKRALAFAAAYDQLNAAADALAG